jgi:hypothetical protein
VPTRPRARSTTKIGSKNNLYLHRHFTEHLVGAFGKTPWDAYIEAHEELETINWQEFKSSFRSHHVLMGVMKLKKKKFEDLKQGSMIVSEYVTQFT